MRLSKRDLDHYLSAALLASRRAGEVHRHHFRSGNLAVERKGDGTPVTTSDRKAEELIREQLSRATPDLGLLGEEWGQEGDTRDRWIIDPLDGTKNFIAGLPYFAILIALELDGDFTLGVIHAPALGLTPPEGPSARQGGEGSSRWGETWWAGRGHGAFAGSGTGRTLLAGGLRRSLGVSPEPDLAGAFITHGGLRRFQQMGLWDELSDLVARVRRTRGFGDWWGHMLVAEGRCDGMVEAAVALHDVAAVKVIIEEAGGAFIARGDAPLTTDFNEAVLTTNTHLAPALRKVLSF